MTDVEIDEYVEIAMKNGIQVILGILIEALWLWAVYFGISYLAYGSGISKSIGLNTAGVIFGFVVVSIGTLPYWLLRKSRLLMAKTTLVTLAVEVAGFLLLLPFSEL